MTSFAVATPSRGLVHSRTIAAVMENVAQAEAEGHVFAGWVFSHDLPIPECDETVAEAALATGADVVWFVEEDVIPPAGALLASMERLGDVVAVDYPVGADESGWGCSVSNDAGEVLWCGLGTTLVARHVFDRLPRPWFRDDIAYVRTAGSDWEPRPSAEPRTQRFGQQDIAFCMALRAAGMRIVLVPAMTAGHARVVRLGEAGTNIGWHTISVRRRITRQYPGFFG